MITQEKIQENTQENAQENTHENIISKKIQKETLTDIQKNIVYIIQQNPQVTRKELVILLDRSTDSIKYHLEQLTKKGILKRKGSTKAGEWVICKKQNRAKNSSS